jgi:hypothetical protein
VAGTEGEGAEAAEAAEGAHAVPVPAHQGSGTGGEYFGFGGGDAAGAVGCAAVVG